MMIIGFRLSQWLNVAVDPALGYLHREEVAYVTVVSEEDVTSIFRVNREHGESMFLRIISNTANFHKVHSSKSSNSTDNNNNGGDYDGDDDDDDDKCAFYEKACRTWWVGGGAHASHSAGTYSKRQPGVWPSLLSFTILLCPSGQMPGSIPEMATDAQAHRSSVFEQYRMTR
jgi:hypothetical protein